MKIFTGEIASNPFTKSPIEYYCAFDEGQQSILNQCVEVDLDEMYDKFRPYYINEIQHILDGCCPNRKLPTFEKFIKEQVKEKI